MSLDALRKEQLELHAAGMKLMTEAADAKRDLTEAEQTEVREKFTKAKALGEQAKLHEEGAQILDGMKAAGIDVSGASDAEKIEQGLKARGEEGADQFTGQSVGELFVGTKQVKHIAEMYPNGPSAETPIHMEPVTIKGSARAVLAGTKAVSDKLLAIGDNTNEASTAGGATIPAAVRPAWLGVQAPVFQPLTLLDVISSVPIQSNLVLFAREDETLRNNAATNVKEAAKTTSSGDDGTEVKPQSAFGFQSVSLAVKLIAHHMAVTNTALADLPQLAALINTFLGKGLGLQLESQIMNGDGTGLNMTGVLHTSGLSTQAAANDILDTTRKAITTADAVFAPTTGFLMSPADIETLDLMQNQIGTYYGNGPFALGPRTLWGVPVIKTFSLSAGTAVSGDLSQIVYFDRQAAQITYGTVNDDFIRNIRRVLAELRGVVGVFRPKAVVKITLP
jgi:HK97 family phage major capsid protein